MARGHCCYCYYFDSAASTSTDSIPCSSHTYHVVDNLGHKETVVDTTFRKVEEDSLLQELDNILGVDIVQVVEVDNVQMVEVDNVQVVQVGNVQVGEAGNVQVVDADTVQVVAVDSP